jgi:hypothetical protein
MHKLYRARIAVAAELGRPAQAFTIRIRSSDLAMVKRLAHQWVQDRNWAKKPLADSVSVEVEEVQP